MSWLKELVLMIQPVIYVSIVMCVITLAIFLRSDAKTSTKVLLVPVSLLGSVLVPMLFATYLGYAVPIPSDERFIALGHNVVAVEGKKKWLEVWVTANGRTRLLLLPYSVETENLLDEAWMARLEGKDGQLELQDKRDLLSDSMKDKVPRYKFKKLDRSRRPKTEPDSDQVLPPSWQNMPKGPVT